MSLALVYSAEHYLIDAIMGAVIAVLAMVGCAWWERRARGASYDLVAGTTGTYDAAGDVIRDGRPGSQDV